MPAKQRSWRPTVAAALVAAALTLGGCAGQLGGSDYRGALASAPASRTQSAAVDSQEPGTPASATLPLRGTSRREVGFGHAFGRGASPREVGFGNALGVSERGSFDRPAPVPRVAGFEVGRLPAPVEVSGAAGPPVRLVISGIGVDTSLVRLGLEADGGMQVPGDFGRAGWFAGGPPPGEPGPAVIAGHVDSRSGPAVFYRLRELRPGDEVVVERADGARLRFLVERLGRYPKTGFPTAAVFGPVPTAALRLVTCAGDFDRARGSYRDNLVVFARLVAGGR